MATHDYVIANGTGAAVRSDLNNALAAIVSNNSSSTAVTFTNPFFTGTASIGGTNAYLPSVGITAQNMQTGDYFQVSSVSGTGFTVSFYDSTATPVTRQFTWTATGYGRAG